MNVSVWDTYVTKVDGSVMHFDILVPTGVSDTQVIFDYGKEYLNLKGVGNLSLTAKECQFCHVEVVGPKVLEDIKSKGYSIVELDSCA